MLFKLVGKGVNLGKIAAILKWEWFCYKRNLAALFLSAESAVNFHFQNNFLLFNKFLSQ
jgi:hypothetical protein